MSGPRRDSGRSSLKQVSGKGEVLVGIINHPDELALVKEEQWYRIPVIQAKKWINNRWPPNWIAFYHTKSLEGQAYGIYYYAPVTDVREVRRRELFPHEKNHPKAEHLYYRLGLGNVRSLERPILSRRWRRIVFIRTTWEKFMGAAEINDLFDESPLEDRLWAELKRRQIEAERQYFVTVNGNDYALDFAIECKKGNLNIETDGDTWHSKRERIPKDNQRDNDLELGGWSLLRFNTLQLNEQMTNYCVPAIVKKLHALGGPKDGRVIDRTSLEAGELPLFDDQTPL